MSVGVVIPTRNMGGSLEKALESACSQFPDRVIVVDDASEDNTPSVVDRFAKRCSFVECVRWEKKQPCHVSALRPIFLDLGCAHSIGLAADDILLPGIVDAIRGHLHQAVIFTHYSCELAGNPELRWEAKHPYVETTELSPLEMRERIQTQPSVETGIGSSLREDVTRWLWDNEWDSLGPHSDSIGYATAAAIFGCVYLPIYGAHISFNPKGYGQKESDKDPDFWSDRVREFTSRVGLDELTSNALIQKRCYYNLNEQFWFHCE